jgi:hypothetical protein
MTTPAGSGRHLDPPNTTVCKVVNLTDSPDPGTGVDTDASDGVVSGNFRYCVQSVPGPTTVVFEVSGYINLTSQLDVGSTFGKLCDGDPATSPHGITVDTGNYLTIAGQTAPSPGITLRYDTFQVGRGCHDVLVQHLRFRTGDENPNGKAVDYLDAFQITSTSVATARNIVVANNSFSWAVDELVESGGHQISYIDNLFYEALSNSKHPKGEHAKGLVATGYGVNPEYARETFVGMNLFAHIGNRAPKLSSGGLVIANNYNYDLAEHIRLEMLDESKEVQLGAVSGNYWQESEIEVREIAIINRDIPGSMMWIDTNNHFNGAIQSEPWPNVSAKEFYLKYPEHVSDTPPLWPGNWKPLSASEAKAHVVANAGARRGDMDSADARIVAEMIAGGTKSDKRIDCVSCTNAECTHGVTNVAEWDEATDYTKGQVVYRPDSTLIQRALQDMRAPAPSWDNSAYWENAGNTGLPRACCSGAGIGTCRPAPGGWPALAEKTRELTLPNNWNEGSGSGYTKLEEWLHNYASAVEGKALQAPTEIRVVK